MASRVSYQIYRSWSWTLTVADHPADPAHRGGVAPVVDTRLEGLARAQPWQPLTRRAEQCEQEFRGIRQLNSKLAASRRTHRVNFWMVHHPTGNRAATPSKPASGQL